ncbi:hypothetical protein [Bizionia arctica]|nr:hypothetical protein [Bizionia arctica]
MKNSVLIFSIFISSFSFAQSIDQGTTLKKNYDLLEGFTNEYVYSLTDNSRHISLQIQNFDNRNPNIEFYSDPYSYKKNRFLDFSDYKLTDELKNVMLEIPGLDRPIDYDPRDN